MDRAPIPAANQIVTPIHCSRFVAGEACAAPSQANVMQYLKNRSLAVEEARPYAPLRLDLLDLPALPTNLTFMPRSAPRFGIGTNVFLC